MRKFSFLLVVFTLFIVSCTNESPRITKDFNSNWKFQLNDNPEAFKPEFDDSDWRLLSVPHDWSIELEHTTENTAASTGFLPCGIGWYRKSFKLPSSYKNKRVTIEFDGIFNNSKVWINGKYLGGRPYGYSSFSLDLSNYLHFNDSANIIAVRVDHSAYADSRWYTGSGIYRNVRLVKTEALHIKQYGIQVTTQNVSSTEANLIIQTEIETNEDETGDIELSYNIIQNNGKIASTAKQNISLNKTKKALINLTVKNPLLWNLDSPNLYTARVEVSQYGKLVDVLKVKFGIRSFLFDANSGFSLNNKSLKIKGVNLHHDAGCLGAAVPKDMWEYRIKKLKSIGVNAIRCAHNPHSPELLDVCDEQGMLVMNEIFDEWDRAKGKNLVYIGDNAAPPEVSRAYPEVFNQWAEEDLKDWAKRDFNHPSVIMLSIGNEIEWTFPYYPQTYNNLNKAGEYYTCDANYDSIEVQKEFNKQLAGRTDTLSLIAAKLSSWVKEIDTTRPVIAGSVQPSVALVSGYAKALDILGFNYRACEYDKAHSTYPGLKILGSENWGDYREWKSCNDRDFVSGVFLWTGFAYLGEAGPWPRKGLNISLFDFAGFKNPRGHFFECLWKEEPKVYIVTTPEKESEFSYNNETGWTFTMQYSPPPIWSELRLWEWYKTYSKWKYEENERIVVQTYTNCEEAELFLNGNTLGKQSLASFADDNIIKWLVPYKAGELKVVGYNKGEKCNEYSINTHGDFAKIELRSEKTDLKADGYSTSVITATLYDEKGNVISDKDEEINFAIAGPIMNIGIDNGWENSVQPYKANSVKTYQGKAILIVQSTQEKGNAQITASLKNIKSNEIKLNLR